MKVRLTKVSSNHQNLRTDIVEGTLLFDLDVGIPIVIIGEPRNKLDGYRRNVTTTPVEKIEVNLYYTKNSIYKIEEIA